MNRSSVEVKIEQGRLQGAVISAEDDQLQDVYAFVGVPFAKPPLGLLRYRAPQAPEPWEGVRVVQDKCPFSVQLTKGSNEVVGSEDCLYLNVFTPALASTSTSSLPVMVWFHGGAYSSGRADHFQPLTLCSQGVVVVAVTYRLGPLGFLSLNSKTLPGNAGLKDCLQGLRWIRDNISVFGGNPNQVTIFGTSAGAGIVHLLQYAPAARGLFHRAIMQSGSAVSSWSVAEDPREFRKRAFRLGELLGCRTQDEGELLQCLRSASPDEIVRQSKLCFELDDKDRCIVNTAFYPCSEAGTDGSGEEMFLTDIPRRLMYADCYYPVPMLAGATEFEGFCSTLKVSAIKAFWYSEEILIKAEKSLEMFIPQEIPVSHGSKESKEIAEGMKRLYFNDGLITDESYFNMCTDLLIIQGVHEAARYHAAHPAHTPVFVYLFTLRSPLNASASIPGHRTPPGAAHGDEVAYIFDGRSFERGSVEARVKNAMARMWASFAKTGSPTAATNDPELENIDWISLPPSVDGPVNYLDIGSTLSVPSQPLFQKRMEFWDDVYRKHFRKLTAS